MIVRYLYIFIIYFLHLLSFFAFKKWYSENLQNQEQNTSHSWNRKDWFRLHFSWSSPDESQHVYRPWDRWCWRNHSPRIPIQRDFHRQLMGHQNHRGKILSQLAGRTRKLVWDRRCIPCCCTCTCSRLDQRWGCWLVVV